MRTKVNNFRIWYEYYILGWPPIILGQKYNIDPNRVCNYSKKYGKKLEEMPVPDKWLCEPRWNRDRDGIKWTGGNEFYEFKRRD